jgi:TolB-like protein/DNA-binding winged helix-turn-helix (wHTH) protein/Flp pilus assembly protein TadD
MLAPVRRTDSSPGRYTGRVASVPGAIRILRFGAFELDLENNQLRRGGVLLKLAPQQFRVLRYLAENAGRICTREEIQQNIWGSEVFVDFDRSLNVCIAQIRATLNDDSEGARFIQTVPRRGYRFISPVEPVEIAIPAAPKPPRYRIWLGAAVLVLATCAGSAAIWKLGTANPPRRTMLAVLPFDAVSGQSADSTLAAGLADELITQAGAVLPQSLGVIARTSSNFYSAHPAGLQQIGRELGVDYLVEGGIRSDTGRVRISARLIKISDQAQVWSESYEQDEAARLDAQQDVAAHITAAIVRALFPSARPTLRAHQPKPEAYEAYLNGRILLSSGFDRALSWFAEAAKRDPAYAEPWAATAVAYAGRALSGAAPPGETLDRARTAAELALRIDADNAEAHNALADVLFWRDWNWSEAQRHFLRAIELNPSMAQARHDYAFYLVATGHPETGVASLRQAIAIDPLSPRVNVDAGWVLLQAHHFEEAVRQARRALELQPGLQEATACIERAQRYRGKRSADTLAPAPQAANPYQRALADAIAGRDSGAIRELQSAYQQRSIMMPLIGTEPAFTKLHSDPHFRELVRSMRLPE